MNTRVEPTTPSPPSERGTPLLLHPDRYFDPDPSIRSLAREFYEEIKDTPILSPHGHVEAAWFADNRSFSDPLELLILPDHYLLRLLYSQGISLESLGVEPLDGSPYEKDRRRGWQIFCEHYYLFDGTPSGAWLDFVFSHLFGLGQRLGAGNAQETFDRISAQLKTPQFLPRSIFESSNVEALSTTNGAVDALLDHRKIRESGWHGRILPCFRPDDVMNLEHPNWHDNIIRLSDLSSIAVGCYKTFIQALEQRRTFFQEFGAVSTDHGVESVYTEELSARRCEEIFARALKKQASADDCRLFTGHMLMEMARMSAEDGLTMQIHPGSFRNHNHLIMRKFGPDQGADIPIAIDYTRNLHALLNKYGNHKTFKLVVFSLDESTYARELAPLAGHYPAMYIGPAWWFHDSFFGMKRFRETVWETASVYNTVGFIDDTRALLSIPARHDLGRRMDCNHLANLVAHHYLDKSQASRMLRALTYGLTKSVYNL